MLDGFAVLHPQRSHHGADAIGGEDPHEVVFHGKVEAGGPRIPLAPGTASELVINAPRFVPLRANHPKATGPQHRFMAGLPSIPRGLPSCLIVRRKLGQLRLKVAPKNDIRAPSRHVGGHRNRAGPPRLGDDFRLPLVELGVEHLVRDAPSIHSLR